METARVTPSLSREECVRFGEEGFLSLPRLLPPAAIAEVQNLLDPLFSRFDELPRHLARDLGELPGDQAPAVRSAEISRPTLLEDRLRSTEVFTRCQQIATELGGASARYTFDHAIYKAPFNRSETPWHQDQAYNGHRRMLRTFHFWVPLQRVTRENGCMQFIPGSHARGLLEHSARPNGHVRRASVADTLGAVVCPLEVGGITIHSPLTLHYTGPNHTAQVRRAWILHFGPWGRLAKWHPSIVFDKVRARLGAAS